MLVVKVYSQSDPTTPEKVIESLSIDMSAFLYPKKDFEVSLKTLVKIEINLPFKIYIVLMELCTIEDALATLFRR